MSEPVERLADLKRPSLVLGTVHLLALWSLAVIQPLLSLLGGNPEFFVARDNTSIQIVTFAVLATLVPPLAAGVVEAGLNLIDRTARWAFHLGLIGLLFAILILQFLKQLMDGPAAPMITVALIAGAGLAWAYGYRRFFRSLTDILVVAPAVILISFMFFSQTSELITGAGDVKPIDAEVGNPVPVVMVIFDEFPVGSLMEPDGDINPRRFPNFARLAGTADWYRNTTTGGSYTTIAIPSIMSGLNPARDSLPTASDHPETLYSLLGGTYRVNALEAITQLCPESICTGKAEPEADFTDALESLVTDSKVVEQHLLLPEVLGKNFPDISQTFGGFGDPGITVAGESAARTRAREFVAGVHQANGGAMDGDEETRQILDFIGSSSGGRPRFDFGHIEEPHYPWNHYPDGTYYGVTSEDFRAFIPDELTWTANRYVTDRATQAHLLETGYVDHLLGNIVRRLKAQGVWDQSLVVFTADHGAALLPGEPRREANEATVGEIATVPLFVKKPDQTEGRVIKRPTCSSEAFSIITRLLKVEVPWTTATCPRDKVVLDNGTGPLLSVPTARVFAERQAYIDRVAALFGADTGWPSVLRLGPNKDLIGKPLASLDVLGETAGAIHPDFVGTGASYFQPGRPVNTALRQRGTVEGAAEGDALAVAVNGTVAAVGQVYLEAGNPTYSILLPGNSLRSGGNDIRVFRADRAGERIELSPLAGPSEG